MSALLLPRTLVWSMPLLPSRRARKQIRLGIVDQCRRKNDRGDCRSRRSPPLVVLLPASSIPRRHGGPTTRTTDQEPALVSTVTYLLTGVSAPGDDGDSADLEELHFDVVYRGGQYEAVVWLVGRWAMGKSDVMSLDCFSRKSSPRVKMNFGIVWAGVT